MKELGAGKSIGSLIGPTLGPRMARSKYSAEKEKGAYTTNIKKQNKKYNVQ